MYRYAFLRFDKLPIKEHDDDDDDDDGLFLMVSSFLFYVYLSVYLFMSLRCHLAK